MNLRIKAFCAMLSCAAVLEACGENGGSGTAGMSGAACLQPLELECVPRYPATFDQIYVRLLGRTCSAAPCHGVGRAGNLMFGDAEAAYARLLNDEVDEPLVIPGDPECSLLMKRLESDDLDFVMPVRNPLDDDELCAIRQWIANGAQR